MKLSLSVRIAEAFDNKEKCNMALGDMVGLARKYGFEAICMRASVAGTHTPVEQVRAIRRELDAAGLRVSMLTGDFAVPSNNAQGPEGLRKIGPYLDLAQELGAPLIRVCMKVVEDIPHARRAAEEAAERGIRLAHQCHTASLFETPEGAMETLRAIGHPNFGLIYEPANWFLTGQAHGPEMVDRFYPHIFNVYVQNHLLNPQGVSPVQTYALGEIRVDHIGIWEAGGVDYNAVMQAFQRHQYPGFVTVHQAFAGVMPVEESVRLSAGYLQKFV